MTHVQQSLIGKPKPGKNRDTRNVALMHTFAKYSISPVLNFGGRHRRENRQFS